MRIAEPEDGVLVVGCADQRNAVAVAGNRHRGFEPPHRDPPLGRRQRRAEIQIKRAAEDQEQEEDPGQNAADHRKRAPTPTLPRKQGRKFSEPVE